MRFAPKPSPLGGPRNLSLTLDVAFQPPPGVQFVFQFSREGTNKTIEKDMVVALLQMVLEGRGNAHVDAFCEFLESGGDENNRISLDSWQNFLTFR